MGLRIGLAGLGVHGARYARHLLAGDVPGAELVAITRADAEAARTFARDHGLAFATGVDELATRSDVDAVVLALPPALHAGAASVCLRAGRPVLVEKPLASRVADARRVARESAELGIPLMVAHTLRFDSVVRALRDELPRLGTLRSISINQRFEPSGRPWIDEPGCGGMLLNTGIHEFDLVRFITGREVVAVQARTSRGVAERTEDQFAAMLALDDGTLAVIEASRATASRSGRIELVGSAGQAWGDHVHRTLCRVSGHRIEERGPLPPSPTIPTTLRAFVDSVAAGQPPPIGADDGVAAVRIVEAALRSAAEDRTVPLDEV